MFTWIMTASAYEDVCPTQAMTNGYDIGSDIHFIQHSTRYRVRRAVGFQGMLSSQPDLSGW